MSCHGTALIIMRTPSLLEAKRKLAESLSDTLIDYQKVQKWDGKLPTVASQSDFDKF